MNIETLAPHALPLAMGFAGAALYHLIGPMLRGCIAIARFASFLCGWAIEAASQRENARAFAWDVVYGKKPTAPNTTDARLRNIESELVFNQGQFSSLACHTAKANVRLDALEERMDKVEEGSDVDYDAMWGGARHVVQADGPYIAYGSTRVAGQGCPCPKPTKDLRPGDEVSVKAIVHMVGENEVDLVYLDARPAATGPMRRHLVTLTYDEFDAMRTDNK